MAQEGLDKVRQVGQAVAQRVGAIIQGAVQNLMTMAEEMTNDHAHPGVAPADARLRKGAPRACVLTASAHACGGVCRTGEPCSSLACPQCALPRP